MSCKRPRIPARVSVKQISFLRKVVWDSASWSEERRISSSVWRAAMWAAVERVASMSLWRRRAWEIQESTEVELEREMRRTSSYDFGSDIRSFLEFH